MNPGELPPPPSKEEASGYELAIEAIETEAAFWIQVAHSGGQGAITRADAWLSIGRVMQELAGKMRGQIPESYPRRPPRELSLASPPATTLVVRAGGAATRG
jgi:hypothetical protein